MKKVMVALAAMAMAVVANAGAVNWMMSGIEDWSGNDYTGPAYLFSSIDGIAESIQNGSFYSTYIATEAYAAGGVDIADEGDIMEMGATSGTGDLTFYTVLVNDAEKPSYYYISEPVTQTLGTNGSKNFVYSAPSQSDWQSVPEPTSGLLLLLGVAGLALRRRRA